MNKYFIKEIVVGAMQSDEKIGNIQNIKKKKKDHKWLSEFVLLNENLTSTVRIGELVKKKKTYWNRKQTNVRCANNDYAAGGNTD